MSARDFLAELLRERFGPVPTAELRRHLPEEHGCGGPDTDEVLAERKRLLRQMATDHDPATGRFTSKRKEVTA